METQNNIVELNTYEYVIDWTFDRKVPINIDEYAFFSCEYRLGTWHLRGHKCDRKTHEWSKEELSLDFCHTLDIAEFIYKANKYGKEKTKGFQGCKVSRFNSMHYENDFYKALQKVFDTVAKLEENDKRKGNKR